jgi:anaerobic magnesium-protoporphyrin IX monomethyl ester cyclase
VGKKVADVLARMAAARRGIDVLLIHVDSFYVIARCSPGILTLASVLDREGFSVKILAPLDLFCLSLHDLKNFFHEAQPAIVGFYTNSDNIFSVRELSVKVKEWVPRARIVAGGPLASAVEEGLLDWPFFDALISGEGEKPVVSYARAVIRGEGRLDEVPSLIFRKEGAIVKNARAPLIEDLDEIPPIDYRLTGSPPRVLSISTGRGCPFKCAFCFQAAHGRRYRYRSPEKVVEEIEEKLEKYDLRIFSITDDTFVAHPERVRRMCDLLNRYRERSGRDFRFYCEARVDLLARHGDLLSRLKEAGLIRLQIGIESGDQQVIDAYNKGITREQVEHIVREAKELGGISVVGNFIIGGAFETEETFLHSLSFAKKLINIAPGVFESGLGFFCPYPGTEISRNPGHFEIIVHEPQFRDNISTLEATCSTVNLSIDRLRVLKIRFHRELDRAMKKAMAKIPYPVLRDHFHWAGTYALTTFWHPYLCSKEALQKYFYFLSSPRFFRLAENRGRDIHRMVPMRTLGMIHYADDGRTIVLDGSARKLRLKDEKECFIYRRSCGKQSVFPIAAQYQSLFCPEKEVERVIEEDFLPFYRKLEKYLYMIFYE